MKKINFKKILLPCFIILMLFVSAFSFASMSHAEDDDEEGERFWFLGREEREEDEWEEDDEEEHEEYEDEDEYEGVTPDAGNIIQTPIIANTASVAFNLAALVDSDQDGVIDSYDKHPNEDDFAYFLLDKNRDGVGDDLEKLLK